MAKCSGEALGRYASRHRRGFSLPELMVVLAILAITLLLAAPSFTSMIRDNQLTSSVFALRATLNVARAEAMARRSPVIACGSPDGLACNGTMDWSGGYLALVGADSGATVSATNPGAARLHWEEGLSAGISLTYSGTFLRFDPMGVALGSTGIFVFCDLRGAAEARGLIVNPVGSVTAAIDDDGDGVVEDGAGSNVEC